MIDQSDNVIKLNSINRRMFILAAAKVIILVIYLAWELPPDLFVSPVSSLLIIFSIATIDDLSLSIAGDTLKSPWLAKAIFTYTRSGGTAKRAARERPTVPIIGLSPERLTARQLALIWGVHNIHALEPKSFSGMIENACDVAKKEKIVKRGDYVVITAGAPICVSGSTNNLRIAKIS